MNHLFSIYTVLSFLFFRVVYFLLKKGNVSEIISQNIPSLMHACISTTCSGYTLLFYTPENYAFCLQVSTGYFISDLVHVISRKNGKLQLIGHHVVTCIVYSLPTNILIMWSLFFAECSNIPNCFNYLLIKAKANPKLIKKVKFYQFYGFLIGRVILAPFMFVFETSNEFTDNHLLFLKIGFGILYPMSLFWTYKLYIGLNK
jgi:hypothetical protein